MVERWYYGGKLVKWKFDKDFITKGLLLWEIQTKRWHQSSQSANLLMEQKNTMASKSAGLLAVFEVPGA